MNKTDNFIDGYDSSDEINIEVTDNDATYIYTVPYKPTYNNRKRLLCYSFLNDETCLYNNKCAYAHSYEEQNIDDDKIFLYEIIFDEKLMGFYLVNNPKTDEIYKKLLFFSNICEQCINKKCTGGFNCRYGSFISTIKICKNDFLSGGCLNKIVEISMDNNIVEKINKISSNSNFKKCNLYLGCINGLHLSQRGLISYYKYIQKNENTKKNNYHSVRYIDIDPINKILKTSYNNDTSSSSTDDELNTIFSKNDIYKGSSSDSESDGESTESKKMFEEEI